MSELAERELVEISADAEAVSDAVRTELLAKLTDWKIEQEAEIQILQKTYRYSTYQECLDFSMAVGDLAERFNHHPRIIIEWGRVQIAWWTHVVSGLHLNDFLMAAKTDLISQD